MKKFLLAIFVFFISCEEKEIGFEKFRNEFQKEWGKCDVEVSCVTVKVAYDSLASDEVNVEPVNRFVKNWLLDFSTIDSNASDFASAVEKIIDEYSDFKKDFPESAISWSFVKDAKIGLMRYPIISVELIEYEFTGGAHGSQSTTYVNFKYKNSEPELFNDFLNDEEKEIISRLIEEEIRKKFGLSAREPLSRAGIWEEMKKIKFNGNLKIEEHGLRVLFNQYEIAPYAMGAIEVFIPYKKIPPSVVEKIFN